MNICFVCAEYPKNENDPTGGFGRYVEILSRGLVQHDNSVTVLCKSDVSTKPFFRNGVRIVPLSTLRSTSVNKRKLPSLIKRMLLFLNYPILWSFIVYAYLKKNDHIFDIIEGGDFGGELFFYTVLRGSRPSVIKLHTPSFVIREFNAEPKNFFYGVMEFLEVVSLKKSTALYSPTLALAKIVALKTGRVIESVIPYPIEEERIDDEKKRDTNLILYVGKMQIKKGVFVLLKAIPLVLKNNQKLKFMFVGPDTLHNGESIISSMNTFIRENKLQSHVSIVGNKEKKDLYRLYSKATLTVVPSLWENFPNVILEAMTHGSIIVASNVGGISEMIKDKKTGYLFKSGDSSDLADTLARVLNSRVVNNSIRDHAKKKIYTNYNLDTIVKKTIEYYESIYKS